MAGRGSVHGRDPWGFHSGGGKCPISRQSPLGLRRVSGGETPRVWLGPPVLRLCPTCGIMMYIIISALNQLAFEASESEPEPIEQFNLTHGLATYVLTRGNEVGDGDTFGRSETERVRVPDAPSMWDGRAARVPGPWVGLCGFWLLLRGSPRGW